MKIIDTIFYNCYHFQMKVGNGDMPVFMSFMMALFAVYLYLASFGTLISWCVPGVTLVYMTVCEIAITVIVGIMMYLRFIHKGRYKTIIGEKRYGTKSNRIITIVFFCGSFFSLMGTFALMWAKNNFDLWNCM